MFYLHLFILSCKKLQVYFSSLKTTFLRCFDPTQANNLAHRSGIREADLQEMTKASNMN